MSLLDERRLFLRLLLSLLLVHALSHVFSLQLSHLSTVVLVERHVVVADEVVAFLARSLRCFAVAELQPSQHRFADVDAAVVHDVGLHHAVAVSLHDLRQRPAEQVVAHVSEVERFVGVGRRVLDHHQWRSLSDGLLAELLVQVHLVEQREPRLLVDDEVEETAHSVEVGDSLAVLLDVLANLARRLVGLLARNLKEREHYEREVALKLLLGLLKLHHLLCHFLTVKLFHCRQGSVDNLLFYCHCYIVFLFAVDMSFFKLSDHIAYNL